MPGGSSSGSASAVAAREVDFALGTDSACSVRLPAALCGLYGIRPTFGRVSLEGVVPLSPSLDTLGWMARTPELLSSVGNVLLEPWTGVRPTPAKLCVPEDAFALADPRIAAALGPSIAKLAELIGAFERTRIAAEDGAEEVNLLWFRVWSLQVREVWQVHGAWIASSANSSVLNKMNLEVGAQSTPAQLEEARRHFSAWRDRIRRVVETGNILCFPTTTGIAPRCGDQSDRQPSCDQPSAS